ncbi:hypothetical protein SCOR_09605 [Sulfidibacter corallicola]|uniref:Uncharacterized protein n=1 Tax=Sulfidibacter corallicola TaxID=2818388 RepID=A0A8A4TLY0_SULCO|nr:hypothetical protein [Sulfidibacter corallicola]QTD50989.1 hypothetical protein J3U87_00840 [Sulfidibacter corallicola]
MFNFITKFAHKSEIRESKDEILIGEIVRAMGRQGYPSIAYQAHDDRQRVRFYAHKDPLLHSIYITLDRKTGSGMISAALIGSKATLQISAEIKNLLTDPDDLVNMFKTDLANMFKVPVIGGIKLNHEMNSVFASVTKIIEIDNYVLKGDAGTQGLMDIISQTVSELREKLKPYKRA